MKRLVLAAAAAALLAGCAPKAPEQVVGQRSAAMLCQTGARTLATWPDPASLRVSAVAEEGTVGGFVHVGLMIEAKDAAGTYTGARRFECLADVQAQHAVALGELDLRLFIGMSKQSGDYVALNTAARPAPSQREL